MVSAELAQQMRETSRVKEQVRLREEEFKAGRKLIEGQKFQLTRQQRQQFTRQQRRLAQRQFREQKSRALTEFKQQQTQFQIEATPIKKSIAESSRSIDEQIAYGYGRKLALRGVYDPSMSKIARRGFKEMSRTLFEYEQPLIKYKTPEVEFRIPRKTYERFKKDWGPAPPYQVYGSDISTLIQTAPLKAEKGKKYQYDKDYWAWVSKKRKEKGGLFYLDEPERYKSDEVVKNLFVGKKMSPVPLALAIGSPTLITPLASTIQPTTEAMPKMESAGGEPLIQRAISARRQLRELSLRKQIRDISVKIATTPKLDVPQIKKDIRYVGERLTKLPQQMVSLYRDVRPKVVPPLKKIGVGVLTETFKRYPTPEGIKRELVAPIPFIVSERAYKEFEMGRLTAGKIVRSPLGMKPTEALEALTEMRVERKKKKELSLITKDMPLSEIKKKHYFSYPDIASEREFEKQQEMIDVFGEKLGKELSGQIQRGSITEQEAKEKYKLLLEKEVEKGGKKISDVYAKATEEVGKKQEYYKAPTRLLTGMGLSIGAKLVGGAAALAIPIYFTSYLLTGTREEYKQMWERKEELIIGSAPYLVGGLIGAKVGKMGMDKLKLTPITQRQIYPLKAPKPAITALEIRKGISPVISKSLFRVKVEYKAWRGIAESPLQRALRLKPLVPLPKAFTPSPKLVTLAPARTYTLVTPRAVTTYKGKILPSKMGYPKVEITRAGARYKVVGELKGELLGIGKAGIKKLKVPSKILTKMGERRTLLPKSPKEIQIGLGEATFKPLYRVRLGKKTPYYQYIRGRKGVVAKAQVKSVLVSKTKEFPKAFKLGEKRPATLSEIGFKGVGEKATLRVRKIDMMRGTTYDLLTGEKLIITKKFKPIEIGALVPKETLFQKLAREFPKKYMGKRGELLPPRQITPRTFDIVQPSKPQVKGFVGLMAPAIQFISPTYRFIAPPVPIVQPVLLVLTSPISKEVLDIKQISKPSLKLITRPVTKIIPRVIITPRTIIKPAIKIVPRLATKITTKLITRPVLRVTTKIPTPTPVIRPPFIFAPMFPVTPPIKEKGAEDVPAYRIWVKRKGRKVFLTGKYPRGEAIMIGTKRTRQTLRATFGIVEKGRVRVKRRTPSFIPSPQIFRTYRIVKGKRVPLKDVWIQKAPYRLSARGEVREIIKAKKKKGGRRKWL
ncbi:hypothetical protein CMI37_01920 [Candidatus Pacearchaeota archaeon]|nr:hypothetical protein [Candidatus Pacearchaeota archaeon]